MAPLTGSGRRRRRRTVRPPYLVNAKQKFFSKQHRLIVVVVVVVVVVRHDEWESGGGGYICCCSFLKWTTTAQTNKQTIDWLSFLFSVPSRPVPSRSHPAELYIRTARVYNTILLLGLAKYGVCASTWPGPARPDRVSMRCDLEIGEEGGRGSGVSQ